MEPDRAPIAPLDARIAQLRRAFGRGLGRKPDTTEQLALDRAARLTARAEAAAHDPNVTANDLVRIDRLAAAARREMFNLLGTEGKREPGTVPLRERIGA